MNEPREWKQLGPDEWSLSLPDANEKAYEQIQETKKAELQRLRDWGIEPPRNFGEVIAIAREIGVYDRQETWIVGELIDAVIAWHWRDQEQAKNRVKAERDAGAVESPNTPPKTDKTPPQEIPQYVTLDQAGALVNRSKSALKKYSDLPEPDVQGGGKGKRNEWLWSKIRPWLEKNFDRKLPERLPDVN